MRGILRKALPLLLSLVLLASVELPTADGGRRRRSTSYRPRSSYSTYRPRRSTHSLYRPRSTYWRRSGYSYRPRKSTSLTHRPRSIYSSSRPRRPVSSYRPRSGFPKYRPRSALSSYRPRSSGVSLRSERSSAVKSEFLRRRGLRRVPPGYEVDHIIPLCAGGRDVPNNMQLLPKTAHKAKTKRDLASCARRRR